MPLANPGAPRDATYITQTPHADLSAEQALNALSSGLAFVTNGTGVVSSVVPGTGVITALGQNVTGSTGIVLATGPTVTNETIITATTTPALVVQVPDDDSGNGHNQVKLTNLASGGKDSYLSLYTDGTVELETNGYAGFFAIDGATGAFTVTAPVRVNSVGGPAGAMSLETAVSMTNATVSGSEIANWFGVTMTATTGTPANHYNNVEVASTFGAGGAASNGTFRNLANFLRVEGSGDATNEPTTEFAWLTVDLGTGFTQTTTPTGRAWFKDYGLYGPIGIKPDALNGIVMRVQNNYNGSPNDSPSGGMWIMTEQGGGVDATHAAATSYPFDVGLGITGTSQSGSGLGFTKAIQIGGTGSPWEEAASKIGTGIHVRDYTTHAIKIDNPSGSPTASIEADGLIKGGTIQASTAYKSVDGSTGATGTVYGSTVKNGLVTAIASNTHQVSMMGGGLAPDSSGNIWQDLFSRLATNDVWPFAVFNFGGTIANNTAPTTRIGLYGNLQIPQNLNTSGTVKIIPVWSSSLTSGDVVWDFDYRVVGGNDTTSLDQSGTQESVSVTDTAPGAAWRRLIPELAPTTSNFTPGATLEFGLFRDGTDGNDTLAGTAVLIDLIFQYTD